MERHHKFLLSLSLHLEVLLDALEVRPVLQPCLVVPFLGHAQEEVAEALEVHLERLLRVCQTHVSIPHMCFARRKFCFCAAFSPPLTRLARGQENMRSKLKFPERGKGNKGKYAPEFEGGGLWGGWWDGLHFNSLAPFPPPLSPSKCNSSFRQHDWRRKRREEQTVPFSVRLHLPPSDGVVVS